MAADTRTYGGFLVVTAVYKTKWCRTRCWSSTRLMSHAGLNDGASDEASFLVSSNTKDQGGLSFPVDKVRLII